MREREGRACAHHRRRRRLDFGAGSIAKYRGIIVNGMRRRATKLMDFILEARVRPPSLDESRRRRHVRPCYALVLEHHAIPELRS